MDRPRPLEERLAGFGAGSEVVSVLKQSISGPFADPKEIRARFGNDKLNITKAITESLTESGVSLQHPDFALTLYRGSLTVHQLNRVLYGAYSTRKTEIKDVLSTLTDYEKLYFLAGVWCRRDAPEWREQLPLVVSEYMMAGANLLWKVYKEKHGITDNREPNLPEYSWVKEQNERIIEAGRPVRQRRYRADIDG